MTAHKTSDIFAWLPGLGIAVIFSCRVATAADGEKVDFLRDVRPILANHCFKCHGPDEEARKAKLRLDVRENALNAAKSGEIPIIPKQPDKSELVRRVFTDNEDDLMPPPAAPGCMAMPPPASGPG